MKSKVPHEDDGGCLYVDSTHRRCASDVSNSCVNRSEMQCGHISSFRAKDGMVGRQCTSCLHEETRQRIERSQSQTTSGIIKLMETITRRPSSAPDGPSFSEYANEFISHLGGIKEVAIKTAVVTDAVLTSNDSKPKDKMDAVGKVISILSLIHKTKTDPIDVSSLDVERLTDDLKKYAKELMVTSREFRAELLSDPEVRQVMLSEAGVTLIDEFELEYSP